MGTRMRREHHRIGQPGLAQRRVSDLLQREIGEPVVDQIDTLSPTEQGPAIENEFGRVGNQRLYPRSLEQGAEQHEFRLQVLGVGGFIDDGNAGKRLVATRTLPLLAEHGEEGCIQRGRVSQTVRRPQAGVEQGATSIGIDLDQAWPGFAQVKVIAEKNPGRPGDVLCRHRRAGQKMRLCGRPGDDRFDGGDQPRHESQIGLANPHLGGGKEVRPTGQQFCAGKRTLLFQCLTQPPDIECRAVRPATDRTHAYRPF